MASGFRDLAIWQKAKLLVLAIYRVTSSYPPEERYGLTSQTRAAANSVAANIAESHGRYYFADKIRVLYQARGEIEEVRSHLEIGKDLQYLGPGQQATLDREYNGLAKGLNSYIVSLRRQKEDQ